METPAKPPGTWEGIHLQSCGREGGRSRPHGWGPPMLCLPRPPLSGGMPADPQTSQPQPVARQLPEAPETSARGEFRPCICTSCGLSSACRHPCRQVSLPNVQSGPFPRRRKQTRGELGEHCSVCYSPFSAGRKNQTRRLPEGGKRGTAALPRECRV